MRLSPEHEAAVMANAIKVTTVNAAALGGPVVDLSPPVSGCDEKAFQSRVIDVATGLGWERVLHPYDSRRSEPGQPDCIFGRTWGECRMVVMELKVVPRKPTMDQLWWLKVFESMGIPTAVFYPDLWADVLAMLRRP